MDTQKIKILLQSWDNFTYLMESALDDLHLYSVLLDIALHDNAKSSWKAAYLLDKIHDEKPARLQPHLEKIIQALPKEKNSSKKRHFLKLISLHTIPKDRIPLLLDFCISHFQSEQEPIAVRVHAMQILYNISQLEPVLKPEIRDIMEHEMEYHPSPGILSRGRKLIHRLITEIGDSD